MNGSLKRVWKFGFGVVAAVIVAAPVGGLAWPAAQPEKKTEPAKQPEKKQPAKESKPPQPADRPAEDIVKDMEKSAPPKTPPVVEPVQPAAANPQPAPAAGAATTGSGQPARLLREGTFLVSRRGRVVRSASGEWQYAFDADAQGQADPTMVLMPCQNLQGMEKVAERYGESATFTVTGQVFVYHNKNYLLPTDYKVNRPNTNVKSSQ